MSSRIGFMVLAAGYSPDTGEPGEVVVAVLPSRGTAENLIVRHRERFSGKPLKDARIIEVPMGPGDHYFRP